MDERTKVLAILSGSDSLEEQARKIIEEMGLPKRSEGEMLTLLQDIKGDGVPIEEVYDEIVDFYALDDDFPDEDDFEDEDEDEDEEFDEEDDD
jgi:hypothetical protein